MIFAKKCTHFTQKIHTKKSSTRCGELKKRVKPQALRRMAQVPKGKNKNKRRSKNEENNRKSETEDSTFCRYDCRRR